MSIKRPVFVLTAEIAAHLHSATVVAKRISLVANNARAITVRAGDNAAGFRAITDFIESFAKDTITRAAKINAIAVEISKVASNQAWNMKALNSVLSVFSQEGSIRYLESISPLRAELEKEYQKFNTDFEQGLKQLNTLLEESANQVRAAYVIASTSKVEASQSGQYQAGLLAISEDIGSAANEIKLHIQNAKTILTETTER